MNDIENNNHHQGDFGIHNGDTYNGCVINSEKTIDEFSEENLYKIEPKPNIIFRWFVAAISLLADIVGICSDLNPYYKGNILGMGFNLIRAFLNMDVKVRTQAILFFIVAIAAIMITVYLLANAYNLTFKSRFGYLRRSGMDVFKVKPCRCPKCQSMMKLVYNGGNYIVCKQNPNEHFKPVSFPQK